MNFHEFCRLSYAFCRLGSKLGNELEFTNNVMLYATSTGCARALAEPTKSLPCIRGEAGAPVLVERQVGDPSSLIRSSAQVAQPLHPVRSVTIKAASNSIMNGPGPQLLLRPRISEFNVRPLSCRQEKESYQKSFHISYRI